MCRTGQKKPLKKYVFRLFRQRQLLIGWKLEEFEVPEEGQEKKEFEEKEECWIEN